VTDRIPRRPPQPRRRDRRGRGLRGPLLPAALPAARSRAEAFDEMVLDSLDRLSRRWGSQLADIEVVVEEVPDATPDDGVHPPEEGVALARAEPATADRPARIVVHRRPVESRAKGRRAREDLVHDVVVEAVADLLGLAPEIVDPERDDDPPL
jgi:predicted Zn-dependent protease with MMP-like domain